MKTPQRPSSTPNPARAHHGALKAAERRFAADPEVLALLRVLNTSAFIRYQAG